MWTTELNRLSIKNQYLIPLVDDMTDRLVSQSPANIMQIKIASEDVYKTPSGPGRYEFNVQAIACGFTHAPATFTRLVHNVFRPILDKGVSAWFGGTGRCVYKPGSLTLGSQSYQHVSGLHLSCHCASFLVCNPSSDIIMNAGSRQRTGFSPESYNPSGIPTSSEEAQCQDSGRQLHTEHV